MKIVSKFKDYYDLAQNQGHDNSLVFRREQREIPKETAPAVFRRLSDTLKSLSPKGFELIWTKAYQFFRVSSGAVLFAGKVYPYAKIRIQHRYKSLFEEKPVFFYDYASLCAVLTEHQIDLKKLEQRPRWGDDQSRDWEAFFNLRGDARWLDILTQEHMPVLSWTRHGDDLYLNSKLADLHFYRALDSWQAYQELSMFLGNIAAPDRVPVEVEEKYRLMQHGFDKWSFRRQPA